ncbi:hypothetical protein E2C01_007773 [Portunus trituberculatus]|uniref:Uncharacterized protein n=1 Tax=Portunus trituberculatus TaxID=210409 RepID=A0A5B7D4S9_PORTR|nr:hypothetical protein [Portunus trituberculatus]
MVRSGHSETEVAIAQRNTANAQSTKFGWFNYAAWSYPEGGVNGLQTLLVQLPLQTAWYWRVTGYFAHTITVIIISEAEQVVNDRQLNVIQVSESLSNTTYPMSLPSKNQENAHPHVTLSHSPSYHSGLQHHTTLGYTSTNQLPLSTKHHPGSKPTTKYQGGLSQSILDCNHILSWVTYYKQKTTLLGHAPPYPNSKISSPIMYSHMWPMMGASALRRHQEVFLGKNKF